ncbi:MAG TPA: hypothetical protein VFW65_23530 [Pseudonocardiaceae bacterium]|nr:hypothetical protein [Pseudonocardiaceae bacterium]
MDATSVGMADSVEGAGNTPIFDELAGRFGLQGLQRFAEAIVPAPADEPAVANESVPTG